MSSKRNAYIDAGLRAHRAGDLVLAVDAYRQALSIAPDDPGALNLLGAALMELGDAAAALPHLERAGQRRRSDAGVQGNLAQAYFELGRYAEAESAFRRATRAEPARPQYQLGIANCHAVQGRLAEAERLLKRLVERFPAEPYAWFNYGNVLRDSGRTIEALAPFRRALELAPHFVDARNNLAGVLHNLQRFAEAGEEFRTCIAQAPGYLLARCNLASVLIDLGRFAEAEALCREVVRADPGMALAHTYLGVALGHQGRLLDALASHAAAARLDESPRVLETYAGALAEVGRHAVAMRRFCGLGSAEERSAAAHQMLGTAQLARGVMSEGWTEYAWRPGREEVIGQYRGLDLATALPDALQGRHVCLLREQGLGDEVYFLRWTAVLKARGARVSYRASDKIRSLLARAPTIDAVLGENEPLPSADLYMLVGDLPRALTALPGTPLPRLAPDLYRPCTGDAPERISVFWPRLPPPLRLAPLGDRVAEMRRRLAAAGPPPYIGVTWRSGTAPEKQHGEAWVLYKECPMDRLAAAVAECRGTALALQRKPATGEIDAFAAALGRPLHDFSACNEELESMLALLSVIDEYVGVSNTNMHLRAGLGGIARVLVPCPAEWRWMHAGARSPWFPDFPVYRQTLQGDWQPALQMLAADLRTACSRANRGS